MKSIWKREVKGYFHTTSGYVFIGVFLLVSSVLFYLEILRQRSGDLPTFLGEMSYLWMLLCPVLCMRLLAEEKQKKTDQLLLTSPVSLPGIVAGKYLAAVTVLVLTAGLTLLYALVVALYGTVYPAELAVNYLGFILQGCVFAALDLYLSGCAATPLTAAVTAFGANFLLWILDLLETAVQEKWAADALRFFSIYRRNEPFLMGQLSFAGLLFDLSLIVLFLSLTVYHLDRKRSGRSVATLVTVLLALVLGAVNLGAGTLEKKNGWRVDLSFNGITTQSRETEQVLDALEKNVKIWALFRKGEEDAPLMELLDRYAARSPRATWEQADPGMNPALLARFTTDSVTPGADSLVVSCEETGRWRVLGPDSFVAVGMDPETGEYAAEGLTYESSLTSAILYVTRERIPRVMMVQGHGELDAETAADLTGLLEANQYEVGWTDLSAEAELKAEDLLVFLSPMRDMTEVEMNRVTEFAAKGGSFLFTCDYTDRIDNMPNYAALMRSYGIVPLEGLVVADRAETDTYYNGNRIQLIPEMCSTDLTLDLLSSGAYTILLPGARAFETPEEGDRNLTVMTVLQSDEKSYRKMMTASTTNMERAEGDPEGPFALALEARRVTAEGYVSRAFALGCSTALTERQLYAMTDVQQLIIRVMEFLLGTGASDLNIMARTALRPALGPGSTGLGSVLIAALPAAVLLAAFLVLWPRKNR